MSNSTKLISFRELSEKIKPVFGNLIRHEKYLAHTPDETLEEHLSLVIDYFLKIIETNRAENVLDNLLRKAIGNEEIRVLNYAKKLFFHSIVFHDHGKINDNFQIERVANANLFFNKKDGKLGYKHSVLSGYLYIVIHFNEIQTNFSNVKTQQLLANLIILFAYPILKHHSSDLKSIFEDYYFSDYVTECKDFLTKFQMKVNVIFEEEVFTGILKLLKDVFLNEFTVFSLIKLNYSLLTASDYYATHHFKAGLRTHYSGWGILNQDSISTKTLKENFLNLKDYNGDLFKNGEMYRNKSLPELNEEVSPDNLDYLRQKLGCEVIDGIDKYQNKRVFYIEAPTGGGKTNLSVVALMKLLEKFPDEITKVFYVFPFTTLITQTAESLRKTLGLTENEMIELHSKAGFHTKSEDENDGTYGHEKENYINNLFVNYPFVLLSHIKFFDLLKTNQKESNYPLHRLINSVVIIDELQTYPPSEWDKVKYFISQYADAFNIRFILMSATLPKIHDISIGNKIEFQALIFNAQENYLKNKNFSERVKFDFSLLKAYKNITYEELEYKIHLESEKYASLNSISANSVFTIVEFIFKKSASEFYNHIQTKKLFENYEILVLSGTILEPRRRYIINFLKDEKNRYKKVLLITTQVVEAGVDIDMDVGFKNQSLLDSDEQLAGRINRNVKKKRCTLFLFNKDETSRIYGKDMRYEFTKTMPIEEKEKILTNKDFKQLYKKVVSRINSSNKLKFTENFMNYMETIKNYQFDQTNSKFKLIDNETESVFVPLDIPLKWKEFPDDSNFTKNEQQFLKNHHCLSLDGVNVVGEKVWKLYLETIKNNKINYVQRTINIKILQGIMSKFIFSTFSNNKMIDSLKSYCEYDEELQNYKIYGFYCITKSSLSVRDSCIYTLSHGLNHNILQESFSII